MPRYGKTLHNTRGFTLVELMVVVAIIGVLAAVSAPIFRRTLQRAAAQESASTIANMLRTARIQAMTTGSVVIVEINSSTPNQFMQLRQANLGTPADPIVARSCLQVTNAALANSPVRTTLRRDEFDANMNVLGMSSLGLASPSGQTQAQLCFSPDGSIQNLGGAPVSTGFQGCNRGFFLVIARRQSFAQLENVFNSGASSIICANNLSKKTQNETRLNREFNDLYIVEAYYNGFITVTQ